MFDVLSILAFVVACVLAVTRDGWGLALVMTMFAFEQVLQASFPIFTQIPALGNIIIGAVVVGAVYRSLQTYPSPFVGYLNLGWIVCVPIFLMACASLLWTPSFGTAWSLTRWGLPYFILFIIAAPLLVSSRASVAKFLTATLLVGTAVTLLIILNPKFTVYRGRLGISLDALVRSNPLAMGEVAGTVVIIAALWIGTRVSLLFVMVRFVALVAGALLCFQSGSRGQLVFAVLISIALYPLAVRLKNAVVFMGSAIALLFVTILLSWLVPQVLGFQEISRWDGGSLAGGVSVRTQNVIDVLGAFAVSPAAWVFGLGFNAFAGITTASSEPYSHVLFVDILAEQGVVAFVLLGLFLWAFQRDFRKLYGVCHDSPRERSSLVSLLGLFLYQTLLVNKQGYLWASVGFFLLGIIVVRLRARFDEGIDPPPEGAYSGDYEVSPFTAEAYAVSSDQ